MRIITYLKNFIHRKPKIIVVLGQSSTGKSDLAVEIAQDFHGEIISADSRQVYRGLDLASGKINLQEMQGIPHYMLDVADISERYTVADYMQKAREHITHILEQGKIPIICGGTGFYIDALVYDQEFPKIHVDPTLREELKNLTNTALWERLKMRDPIRAQQINPSNRVRLIRSLEIIETLGYMPKIKRSNNYDVLFIGLHVTKQELQQRVYKRIINRLDQGMIDEIQQLHESGVSFDRLHELGLEARNIGLYLQGRLNLEEMLEQLYHQTMQFTKRQKTWFKRNKHIHWFDPIREKEKIHQDIKDFLI